MRPLVLWILAIALLTQPNATRAQEQLGRLQQALLDGNGLAKPAADPKAPTLLNVENKLVEYLSNPDTLDTINRTVKKQLERVPYLAGLDLKLKTFSQDGGDSSLGFAYAYEKTVRETELHFLGGDDPSRYASFDFSFAARGNVAFDHHTNPADFLDTNVSVGLYNSWGGVARSMSLEEKQQYAATTQKLAALTDEQLWQSPDTWKLLKLGRSRLTNQFALDLRAKAGLESNQDFSTRQLVYGGEIGFVPSGWERFDARTWDDASTLAKFNVFDYPFALVRWATGYDEGFTPRGISFPALRAGLAFVDPDSGDPRAKVGDGSSFPRFDAEVSFRTPLFDVTPHGGTLVSPIGGILENLGVISFNADYRYYRELDASAAVKKAHLDQFGYFALAIGSSGGAYFTWANGKVPFDAQDDNIFEVGYKFHF